MRIIVYEDDHRDLTRLRKYIEAESEIRLWNAAVTSYDNAQNLLQDYTAGGCDLLFLDLYPDEINGLDAAQKIRRMDPDVLIVFCTGDVQQREAAFDIPAIHWLIKPITPEKVSAALDRAADRLDELNRTVTFFPLDNRILLLPARRIILAERTETGALISAEGLAETAVRQTLPEIGELLGTETFFHCHHDFLISLRQVTALDEDGFHMRNGRIVPVSRRKKEAARKTLARYSQAQMWSL